LIVQSGVGAKLFLHVRLFLALLSGMIFTGAHGGAAFAGEAESAREAADSFEDKHLFGFTEGSDVGEAGGKEAEFTTTAGFGKKRGGQYQSIQQEAAFEGAATDRFGYELGVYGSWQTIANVPGLDNLSQVNFSGLSFMPKYIFLRRGIDAPIGFAVSLEPAWERIDAISGGRVKSYSMETRVYFDKELIARKLLAAANLVYAPEVSNDPGGGTSQYALFGATGALSYLVTPDCFVGGEIEYYQAYQSLGFSNTSGSALYIGPTLHLQLGPKAFISLAWSEQVSSSPRQPTIAALEAVNQADLARQRGHMVFGVEF
jgi:hypothetical protein